MVMTPSPNNGNDNNIVNFFQSDRSILAQKVFLNYFLLFALFCDWCWRPILLLPGLDLLRFETIWLS